MADRVRDVSAVMTDYGRLLTANAAFKRQLALLSTVAEQAKIEAAMAANRREMSRLMKLRHATLREARAGRATAGVRREEEE